MAGYLYEYLETDVPDVDQTFSTPTPKRIVEEPLSMNQKIHYADDGSEARLNFSTSNKKNVFLNLVFENLTFSESAEIMEFYCDSSKGNGMINSFKFDYIDGYTYVVRFDCNPLTRVVKQPAIHSFTVRLRVLGYVA